MQQRAKPRCVQINHSSPILTDHGPFHQLKKALSKNSANLPSSQSIHYGAIVSIIFSNLIHIMHLLTPALPPQPSTPSNSSQPLMMRKPVRPSHPYRAVNFADSSVRLEQNSGPSGLLNALALRFILDVHPLILRWSIWAWDFAVHLRFFFSFCPLHDIVFRSLAIPRSRFLCSLPART